MATLGGAEAWPLISNIAESDFRYNTGLYEECLTLMASGENSTRRLELIKVSID